MSHARPFGLFAEGLVPQYGAGRGRNIGKADQAACPERPRVSHVNYVEHRIAGAAEPCGSAVLIPDAVAVRIFERLAIVARTVIVDIGEIFGLGDVLEVRVGRS